jgi:hydroxymethylpyrimidine/phosphomethylpyrimidine kinase
MVASSRLVKIISENLRYYQAKNIVVDPVLVATSGAKLIQEEAVEALKHSLFRQAVLLTPNIPEASILSGILILDEEDMKKAAEIISNEYGCSVLLKGGHSINDANDLLYTNHTYRWFFGERIDNPNTHGTGCTLSSAITSGLARGLDLETSILYAKKYISGALKSMLNLGKGSGPLNHGWNIKLEENV